MWTRKELKDRAKAGLKRNYLKSVVYALILSLILGAGAVGGRVGSGSSWADIADEISSRIGVEDAVDSAIEDFFDDSDDVEDAVNSFYYATDDLSGSQVGMIVAAVLGIMGVGLVLGVVIRSLIYNPAKVGISKFAVDAVEGTAEWSAIGVGYKPSFLGNVWSLLCRDVVVFLWSLLLVIPGIIKGYSYSQVEYVLAENPGMSAKEAMAKSRAMMHGNKWKAFVLNLSFLGWDILNVCTAGILGLFYVAPYKMLTKAALYEELKKNA